MSMYDRDWYRESYSKRESLGKQNGKNASVNVGRIATFIVAFAAVFAAVMYGAQHFVGYPATIGLIAVNVIIFALIKMGKLYYESLFSSYEMTIMHRGYYRIVSSAFTHEEPLHIIMNMGSLYNLGVVLEPVLGSYRYTAVYVVIMMIEGFISAMLHKIKSPYTRSIGTSGVICGLLGVYMVLAVRVGGIMAIRSVLPTLAIMCLMTASKKIDSIAHFVGLGVGIVCAAVMLVM